MLFAVCYKIVSTEDVFSGTHMFVLMRLARHSNY